MKIKLDFITNSSTTSYVMLGYKFNFSGNINNNKKAQKELEDLEGKAAKVGYGVFAGSEMGAPSDEQAYVGIVLGEMSSEDWSGFQESEFDIDEIMNKLIKLKADLGLPAIQKIKIITSTRMS